MNDFASLEKKVLLLQQEFSGEAGKRRLNRVAVQTKKDVDEAVKADLGDQSMSGWRRSKPINIKGRYDLVDDHTFRVVPNKPGPMRVLEEGRNRGKSGPVQRYGKKGRKLKLRRWNGHTQPKHTWSEAVTLMQRRIGGRVDQQVQQSIGKFFRG